MLEEVTKAIYRVSKQIGWTTKNW